MNEFFSTLTIKCENINSNMTHPGALSTDQNSTKNASLMGKNTIPVPKSCVPNEILTRNSN